MPFHATSKKPIIGITLGDPSGIGPEVTAKALAKAAIRNLAYFKIIGHKEICRPFFRRKYKNCILVNVPVTGSFKLGHPNRASGESSFNFLKKAVELIKDKQIQALVTAPVSKEAISNLGYPFQGHTEFLADAFQVTNFEMMFVYKSSRVVSLTRHIPLNKVSQAITSEKVYRTIKLTTQALKEYFGIKQPILAVCGLNPHAGEGGKIGKEEKQHIKPAIMKALKEQLLVEGPFAADTLFNPKISGKYDAIIAMYHDQGLISIKTLYFNKVVNLTIGLPFIRTSPPHGTAFNIAGKNIANPDGMCEAIKLAVKLSHP